ncbi:MAG: hypothetical protein O3A53_09910 [Acidobacteria bacterium]|nr:hypothetical protein [Acidobacteriota bacterium]MDA1235107.1 hypothetical protein [Acidobacteriota bacterium]
MNRAVLLDTTVFILWLVGRTDRSYIRNHNALSAYTENDFDLLVDYLRGSEQLLVTPHVLAETSNLAKRILPPARDAIYLFFREIVEKLNEVSEASSVAMKRTEFVRLGLTDAALLDAASSADVTLLTADLGLYLAALNSGYKAVNFAHLQEEYLYS